MNTIKLSSLSHTWIIDLDGTILKHNGHIEGGDRLLKGVRSLWKRIPLTDMIILVSARDKTFKKQTKKFLDDNQIRYDHIIFGVPTGERLVINDIKPSGLKTAYAINVLRDDGLHSLLNQIRFCEVDSYQSVPSPDA